MIKFTQIIIIFMVGALLQGFGSLVGAASQNTNLNNALRAQKEENQKNREYNLMLAQKQNEWNIQQWERSNEYNNPLNQMLRLKQANLNPNLVYGNGAGQSLAAPNPQLTSGQPSTPQDMSLLAQRPTIGQVFTQSLNNRLLEAQIKSVESSARKNNVEAGLSENDLKYRDMFNALGIDSLAFDINMKSQQVQSAVEQFNLLQNEVAKSKVELQSMKLDVFRKKLDNAFREKEMIQILRKLSHEADISEYEAKFAMESYASRLILANANASIVQDNASIPKFLEDIKNKNKIGEIGSTLFRGIRYLLGFINPLL